jgi:hypothetical protein
VCVLLIAGLLELVTDIVDVSDWCEDILWVGEAVWVFDTVIVNEDVCVELSKAEYDCADDSDAKGEFDIETVVDGEPDSFGEFDWDAEIDTEPDVDNDESNELDGWFVWLKLRDCVGLGVYDRDDVFVSITWEFVPVCVNVGFGDWDVVRVFVTNADLDDVGQAVCVFDNEAETYTVLVIYMVNEPLLVCV